MSRPRDLRAEYVGAVSAPLICGIIAAWLAGSLSLGTDAFLQFLCAFACLVCVILTGASAWKIASENVMLYWTVQQLQRQRKEDDAH